MKNDYKNHLFVPPEKGSFDTISDIIDDTLSPLSRLFKRKESPQETAKKLRDGMILHNRQKR